MRLFSLFATLVFFFSFSLTAMHHPGGKKHKRGKHRGKHMKRMLQKIDTNKDGKISKQEWSTHHEQRFAEIDANKDGNLTKEEFKAFRKKMRKKHREMRKKDGPAPNQGR